MFLIYIVTFSIFPGYITEDVHSDILKDWYPILLISISYGQNFWRAHLKFIHQPEKRLNTNRTIDLPKLLCTNLEIAIEFYRQMKNRRAR